MRSTLFPKALLMLISIFLVSSCSGQESTTSTGSNNQKKLAIDAANKALVSKGYEGFKPTGEIHQEDDSESKPGYEIIFSDGSKTLEVDVVVDGNTPVEIEEDIELADIPNDVRNAATNTGEDINSCGHYQKAIKLDADNEVWFEFEECNNGKVDIEVKKEGLKVVTENDDNTARDIR